METVPDTENIVIMNVDYMKKLGNIIGNTSRRSGANILIALSMDLPLFGFILHECFENDDLTKR